MPREPIFKYVRKIGRPVFSTREMTALSSKSPSAAIQGLAHLARQGVLVKVRRGLWADASDRNLSPFTLATHLTPGHRSYVSFISALHLHGIVEQIPRVVTLASTAHSRTIRTGLGDFIIHRINPAFFGGFDWYRGGGSFLIASPEKALVDSLYLSVHRKKQYGHFPELHFPKDFSFRRAAAWAGRIPSARVRARVSNRLEQIKKSDGKAPPAHG